MVRNARMASEGVASEGVASGEGVSKGGTSGSGVLRECLDNLVLSVLNLLNRDMTTVLKNLVTCREGWCHDYIIIYLSRQFMLGSRWSQSIIILYNHECEALNINIHKVDEFIRSEMNIMSEWAKVG